MNKPTLLWVSEASFLKTGFSKIGREILSILHNRGNINIVELGSYAKTTDPRAKELPWKFHGAVPDDHDEFGKKRCGSNTFHRVYNQFGSAMFEQVCLNNKPVVAIDIRDRWMQSWILHSPYRKYFKFYSCPTVDGRPQRTEWLDEYRQVDKLFTYTKFGKETLSLESPGINVTEILRPGVNPNIFVPLDKNETRDKYGIPHDWNIVLSVMRNQKRKLFPNLMEAFAGFIKHCASQGNIDLANKSYLFLHTSLIDVGYDIQKFAIEYGIANKVLITYICRNCNHHFISKLQTEATVCSKCRALAAVTCNTNHGIDEPTLNEIYNIADVYIQHVLCEGLSMTPLEARCAGLNFFGTNYSALEDQVNEPGGNPVEVEKFFWETMIETEQSRALPSEKDLIQKLYKFFQLPESVRIKQGLEGRDYVSKHYSFERAADILEREILSDTYPDHSLTWESPLQNLCPLNQNINPQLPADQFVDACIDQILGQPERKNTYWRDDLVKSLIYQQRSMEGTRQYERFTKEDCVKYFVEKAQEHNYFEKLRLNHFYGQKQEERLLVQA